jgi:hypothetical protein
LKDILAVANDKDAPKIFTEIRNAIVHSNEDKRKKLTTYSLNVRFEALTIGVWYIELIMLYLLKYKGKYENRCSSKEESFDDNK